MKRGGLNRPEEHRLNDGLLHRGRTGGEAKESESKTRKSCILINRGVEAREYFKHLLPNALLRPKLQRICSYASFPRSLVHSYRMSISMSSIIEPALLMWGLTLASYSITLVCCLVMHPDRLVSPTCGGGEKKGRGGGEEGKEGRERGNWGEQM